MGRSPCRSKEDGLKKGPWTAMEDKLLTEYINMNGEGKWRKIPKKAGLQRCGKSCRLRWLNYLRPGIKRGNITNDEEDLIIRLHNLLGNRWALIAGRLPGRTDNEIKNYWNTIIWRKLQNQKPQPKIQQSISLPPIPNFDNQIILPTIDQPHQNNNNNNNNNSCDLLLDFEMNDGFLSELLSADFSEINNFEQCQVSTNSDQSMLDLNNHAIRDSGLPSVSSDEFDWLGD